MMHRKKRFRLKSIIYIDEKLSVKFDYNVKEKFIGSSDEKQSKFDKLRSVDDNKKIQQNKNKISNQNIKKSQAPLLEQKNNKISNENINNSTVDAPILQVNNNSNSLKSKESNQIISNIFEIKKNNSINEILNNDALELNDENKEDSFFNLKDSFTFSDSDSFIYYDYLNNDDQTSENNNCFNTFLF